MLAKSPRLNYFIYHLLLSIVLISLIFIAIIFLWYPTPLLYAVGGVNIALTLLIVDIIIGPILSFLVYKEGKKTLKLDLIVILILQISALLYGLFNFAQGRPVWIVQNEDRFELIRAIDVVNNEDKLNSNYKKSSWFGPQFVALSSDSTRKEEGQRLFKHIVLDLPNPFVTKFYVPLASEKNRIDLNSLSIDELIKYNSVEHVEIILKQYPSAKKWMPLKTNNLDMVVLLNKNSEVVRIVDLHPW